MTTIWMTPNWDRSAPGLSGGVICRGALVECRGTTALPPPTQVSICGAAFDFAEIRRRLSA